MTFTLVWLFQFYMNNFSLLFHCYMCSINAKLLYYI
nr:MAG TPA: hypothetical protein [Caudoviricetes sp.]